jgi:heme/copper-type cytochrome/quinol oxidase subunit 2
MRHRPQWPEESRWFWVGLVFCSLIGLAVTGVLVWAVITVVQFITR